MCVKASKCPRCLLSELCRVIQIRPQETATVLKHCERMEANVVFNLWHLPHNNIWKHNKTSICVGVRSASYFAFPLLQHRAHVSFLCIGPCCVSQTISLQGVGTCMHTTHTSIQFMHQKNTGIIRVFLKKKSPLSTGRICSHNPSGRVNMSIDRLRSGVRGRTGSGVSETHCSEGGGPCNDPVGGFISATRGSNNHFDPYTNTRIYYTIYTHCRFLQRTHFHTAGRVKWRKTDYLWGWGVGQYK